MQPKIVGGGSGVCKIPIRHSPPTSTKSIKTRHLAKLRSLTVRHNPLVSKLQWGKRWGKNVWRID